MDVAEANRLNALYLFSITNLDSTVTLEAMEAMASRYALMYRELAVLVGELYRIQGGKTRQERTGLRYRRFGSGEPT